jgi:predicted thioesterase
MLARDIPIGVRGEAEETVEFKYTLTAHDSRLPPVYSTPDMIRLMETAAFLALQPYCEGDEISVGTSIHVEHRAASGIGARIKAEATLRVVRRTLLCLARHGSRRYSGDRPRDRWTGGREHWEISGKDEARMNLPGRSLLTERSKKPHFSIILKSEI